MDCPQQAVFCRTNSLFVLRWAMLTLTSSLLSADFSESCEFYNPSDLALLLTHCGTLLISKFARMRKYEFSRTISED